MSCGCSDNYNSNSAYNGYCNADTPYPSVSHESVPSLIDNLVTALYGEIQKDVSSGKVVWNIPCDPSNIPATINGIPRNDGEGLLCYIVRALNLTGASGFVTVNGVQTLTNKTLTAPVINTPTINNLTATGTLALPTGSVTSAMILNGTIINEDINASAAIATSKLAPVTATGSTTPRTLANRFADVVNVKDFGAVGNGSTPDHVAIQAAIDHANSLGGGIVFFPVGSYRINTPIELKSFITIQGVNAENTRIVASGNFPVLQHIGSSDNGVGDINIRDIQIRGSGTTNQNCIGILASWTSSLCVENCYIRLCSIGYYQDYSRNGTLINCQFDTNKDCIWMGPIDTSLGANLDNTAFWDTLDCVNTVRYGVRIEGATGIKAINCAFLNGDTGIYSGDYVPENSPLAILLGNTSFVPTIANARNIRWLHMTNCYSDTTSSSGWIVNGIATGNNVQDCRFVSCWAGNTNNTNANSNPAFSCTNFYNIILSGCTFRYCRGIGISFNTGTGLTINGSSVVDYDALDAGLAAIKLDTVNNATISGVFFDSDDSSVVSTTYGVHLVSCNYTTISGLTTNQARLVNVVNSFRTAISNNTTNNVSACVLESGTSNFTRISNTIGGIPTLIGGGSSITSVGSTTNVQTSIVGGSTSAAAICLASASNTGWYRDGNSMSFTLGGSKTFGILDNGIFNGGAAWYVGSGSPEGNVTAPIASLYTNTAGGASTTLYVKTSGTGNTGWTAK
jgi:hypothetical protein